MMFLFSKNTILKILLTTLIGYLLVDCKSRDFKVRDSQVQEVDSLSEADRAKKSDALDIANSGNREFQRGRYEESLAIGKKSLDTFLTAEGYFLTGTSYSKLGKNEEAKQDLESASRLDPTNEQILITLALVHTALGEDEAALKVYGDLSRKFPEEPIYPFRKAIQLKAMTRYKESLAVLDSISVEKFPHKTEYYSQKGDVYLKLKNYKEAERYLSLAEESSPDSKSLKATKSSIQTASHLENGNRAMSNTNYDLAIEEYTKATKLEPRNPSPLIFLANAFILNKEYRDAEKTLDKAIAINREFPPAYTTYSALYYQEKKYNQSIQWADNGLKIFSKSAALYNRRGLARWKLADTRKAGLEFRRAVELEPNFFEAENNLAFLLMEEGRFGEAKQIFNGLSQKNPANKDEYKRSTIYCEQSELIGSGDRFLQQGKISNAMKLYDQAKLLNADEPAVWNAYGRANFILEDYPKAEANFTLAYSLDDKNIPALQGLIRLYSKTRSKAKEKATIAKLEKLTSGDPLLQILMGRIKEDNGDYDAAEKAYLAIRKQNPENTDVSLRLGSLYYKMAVQKNTEEEYSKALALLEKAKKENPNISEIPETERIIRENQKFMEILPTIKIANNLYDRKRFSEAIKYYNDAFKISPRPNLLVKVAECHVGMGEEEKALTLLKNASQDSKTESTDYKEAIYSFFLQKGEVEKAEKGFYEVLSVNPGSYFSYYKLGLIEMSRKNYDKSISLLDKSLILNYNFPAGNVAKGVVYYKKGDPKSAKQEFERAKTKDNELDVAIYNLGILYFNQDMDKEARKIFSDLLKTNPESAEAYHQLSYLDFKEGNLPSAEKNILKALDFDRNPSYLFAYTKILESKKDQSKWKEIAREITEKYPSTTYASRLKNEVFKDEPMYFQNLEATGVMVSEPLQIGDVLIANYGTSMVATDLKSKQRLWRIFTTDKNRYIDFDLKLYGGGNNWITSWDVLTGEKIASVQNSTLKGYTIGFLGILPNGNLVVQYQDKDSSILLSYSPGLSLLNMRSIKGRYHIAQKPGEDLFSLWSEDGSVLSSGNWTQVGQELIPISSKESILSGAYHGSDFYLLTKAGYYSNSSWKKWNHPIDRIFSSKERFLFQSGSRFYKWKGGSDLEELEFAESASSVLPLNRGFLVWKDSDRKISQKSKSSRSQKLFYYDDSGKEIADSLVPDSWQDRSSDIIGVTIQDLSRSK